MYTLIEHRIEYPSGKRMLKKIGESVHVDLLKEQVEETVRSYGSSTSGRTWIEDDGNLIFETRLGKPLYTITDHPGWTSRRTGCLYPPM